ISKHKLSDKPGMKGWQLGGWIGKYESSFAKAMWCLTDAGYTINSIYHPHPAKSDVIYVLNEFFPKFLEGRLIDEYEGDKLYSVEDRRLFFKKGQKQFTVYSYKYKTIKDIRTAEVLRK